MNDLNKHTAQIWNYRLRDQMDKHNLKQASLATAMNGKYGTFFGQKDVSRWLNVGAPSKNKKGEIGFPKYETMLLIADFFSVDIGFLTGETDQDSFDTEKAMNYLGLITADPLKTIRDITHPDTLHPNPMIWEMRIALNQLLGSHEFKEVFLHIYDLYSVSPVSGILDDNKSDHYEGAMGYSQDVNDSISLYRFKVYESFFALLDKLYPYSTPTDFLLEDEE